MQMRVMCRPYNSSKTAFTELFAACGHCWAELFRQIDSWGLYYVTERLTSH